MGRRKINPSGGTTVRPLKGGVGGPAPPSMGDAIAAEMRRLSVNRPSTSEYISRRLLSVKDAEQAEELMQAVSSAARQHLLQPDDGSALYARAWASLPEERRVALLESLPQSTLDIEGTPVGPRADVERAFGNVVEPDGPLAPVPETIVRSAGGEEIASSSQWDALSPDAQRAAARLSEMLASRQRIADAMAQLDPTLTSETAMQAFDSTKEGQSLLDEALRIANKFPEAGVFAENPTLMTTGMPDRAAAPSGGYGLPTDRTLWYRIGDEASRYRIEKRPERRIRQVLLPDASGTLVLRELPADAPNRVAWLQLDKAARSTLAGKPTTVYLPPSNEVSVNNRAPESTELPGAPLPRLEARLVDKRLTPEEQAAAAARQADQDRLLAAEQAEIEADLQKWLAEQEREFPDDPNAAPVEDISQEYHSTPYWQRPENRLVEPLAGSATGSPSKVRWERDYALREGKPAIEKLREQVFRVAMEYTPTEMIGVSDRGGLFVGESGRPLEIGTPEYVDDVMEAGMETGRSRAGGGRRPRPPSSKPPLNLDALAPAWRGHMHFQEGPEIVVRRPNAREVSAFIVEMLDMPDAGLASRLEAAVQASMDMMEPMPPSNAKSKRAAGTVFEPSASARKEMERAVMRVRGPNDQRPLYNLESKRRALQASEQHSVQMIEDPIESPAVPAETSGAGPVEPATTSDNPFAEIVRRMTRNKGTIPGLLALVAAGAAGESRAEGGDLPPVEYLAMASGRRGAAARKAAQAAKTAADAAGAVGTTASQTLAEKLAEARARATRPGTDTGTASDVVVVPAGEAAVADTTAAALPNLPPRGNRTGGRRPSSGGSRRPNATQQATQTAQAEAPAPTPTAAPNPAPAVSPGGSGQQSPSTVSTLLSYFTPASSDPLVSMTAKGAVEAYPYAKKAMGVGGAILKRTPTIAAVGYGLGYGLPKLIQTVRGFGENWQQAVPEAFPAPSPTQSPAMQPAVPDTEEDREAMEMEQLYRQLEPPQQRPASQDTTSTILNLQRMLRNRA